MFTLKTNKEDVFISTGKIATQTLGSISGAYRLTSISDIMPGLVSTTYKAKEDYWIDCITKFKKLNPNSDINIVIRYPYYRFISGLFEIFGKSLIYTMTFHLKTYLKDDIVNVVPMFYDTDMWIDVLNLSLAHLPTFDKSKPLNSAWLDYHLGNWLGTVDYIKDRTDVNIVDIDDLTFYLRHRKYEFAYKNRSTDILIGALSRNSHYKKAEEISKNINAEKMTGAYRKAVSLCARADEYQKYIEEESIFYQKLIRKKLFVEGADNSLKIF